MNLSSPSCFAAAALVTALSGPVALAQNAPPGAASAPIPIAPVRPGLWEYKVKVSSRSGQIESVISQAQSQLAQLPPEQRQKIERMMASRGVSLDAGLTTVKVCLSKEDAERGSIPLNLQRGNCTQSLVSTDGRSTRVAFSCDSQPPASGTGDITVHDPATVSIKGKVDTLVAGRPEQLDMSQEGRWLSAECGELAPLNAR